MMTMRTLIIGVTGISTLLLLLSLLYLSAQSTIPFQPTIKSFNSPKYPVTFAYLISASSGDAAKLKRTLRALYHPANYYLLHLDAAAPPAEREEVARFLAEDPVYGEVGNVWMVGKSNLVTYRGPTMLASTLHAMAVLLRRCEWDWFINLSASDYPLITQDDLIHVFSDLPRDLNFVQHTSRLGWKLNKRGKPIIIDPGLYSLNKSDIWWAVRQRPLPTAFKLYTGFAPSLSFIIENAMPNVNYLIFTSIPSSPAILPGDGEW